MTKRELEQKLLKAGWVITHDGAYDLATNPQKPGVKIRFRLVDLILESKPSFLFFWTILAI